MSENTSFPVVPFDKQYNYVYDWDIELLSAVDEKIKVIPKSVDVINKDNDYIKNTVPVTLLKMTVRKKDIFKLTDNEKDIIASVSIKYKVYIKSESGDLSLLKTGIIATGTYTVTFSKKSLARYLRRDEIEADVDRDSDEFQTNGIESERVEITVGLSDIVGINLMKVIYNECFDSSSGITPGAILNYIAYNSPAKSYLIDKPDNDYSFTQDIILPPLNFTAALKYVQNVLGCYENGLNVFYDDDVLYILNRFSEDHDVAKGETNIVHMYSQDTDTGIRNTIYTIDDDGNSVYVGNILFEPQSANILNSELNGDNFIFSSFKMGADALVYEGKEQKGAKPTAMVLKHNTESHSQSGSKNVLDYDELNNPYVAAAEFNFIEATAEVATISVKNVNILDFKPNKYIHMHFKDNRKEFDYGGKWHILAVSYAYIHTGMDKDRIESDAMASEGKVLTPTQAVAVITISRRKKES